MSEGETSPENQAVLEVCPHCATLIDVSDEPAFSKVHCPSCGGAVRVRKQFNYFQLIELLGEGGMGSVYKALDMNLNRFVALKLLKREYGNDREAVDKLEREARITASINHPHVVKVFSFGEDRNQFYLAMELVEQGSLDDFMQVQGRIGEIQALNVGIQIAQGLEAAYAKGLIHSDVKPGNILFADAHTAKIVDFGLATLMEQEAEEKGEIWGTPYYVSPERLNKEPEDFRSDIYSLGGTLFHALAGRPPFEDETASLVALKHIRSRAVSLQAFAPDVSSETAYVINRMLKREPEERYASYAELIEHLTYARNKCQEGSGKAHRAKARVVVEDEKSNLTMGIISLVMILSLIVVGVVVVKNFDRLTGRDAAETSQSGGGLTAVEAEREYQAAKKLLLENNFSEAEMKLQSLSQSGPLAQPLKNWVTLHEGMALLLQGKTEQARPYFKELETRDLFSRDPADSLLANFFVETGRNLSTGNRIPSSVTAIYSRYNVEALSIALFALNNWYDGHWEDGALLAANFQRASPRDPYKWVAEYKPLFDGIVQDYKKFKEWKKLVEAATTPEEMKKLEQDGKLLKTEFRTGRALGKAIDEVLEEVKKKP